MAKINSLNPFQQIFCLFIAVSLLFGLAAITLGEESLNSKNLQAPFYEANAYYQKGQYQKALELYLQMASSGNISGNLYYNIGNSYFKLGQKGKAVLYYEKAQQLIPGDADLRANLAYVKEKAGEQQGSWQYQLYHYLAYLATANQLLVIGSVFFFLLGAIVIYMVLFPKKIRNGEDRIKPLWFSGLSVVGVLLLLTVFVAMVTIIEQTQPRAVMIQESADVRFEPNSTATLYYQLKEGASVDIVGEKDDWLLIKRPDGKRGWVEQKYLEKI